MRLENLLTAAALSLTLPAVVPAAARAEDPPALTDATESHAAEELAEEGENNEEQEKRLEIEDYARKEVGGLAIKGGYTWTGDKRFITRAASLMPDGYLAEFRFRKQDTNILREDDQIKIAGITLEGERRYKAYQTDFTFGFELWGYARRWYDLKLLGQVTGGFQVIKNLIKIEGEDFPGDPDIDFFAGGGVRPEAVFRIPRIGRYYASIGAGGTLEYLFTPDDEFMQQPVRELHYSAYGLVRFSQESERKELRLKKE